MSVTVCAVIKDKSFELLMLGCCLVLLVKVFRVIYKNAYIKKHCYARLQ